MAYKKEPPKPRQTYFKFPEPVKPKVMKKIRLKVVPTYVTIREAQRILEMTHAGILFLMGEGKLKAKELFNDDGSRARGKQRRWLLDKVSVYAYKAAREAKRKRVAERKAEQEWKKK